MWKGTPVGRTEPAGGRPASTGTGTEPSRPSGPPEAGPPTPSMLQRLLPDAPSSPWALALALHRVAHHDSHRAFLTRLGLWAGLVVVYLIAPAPWWAWFALVPTPLQTTLEMLSHRHLTGTDGASSVGNPLVRLTVRTAAWASGKMLLNFTGLLGGLATAAQILAVLFALPVDGPSWARPVGLALALGHLASGTASVMLDPPWYNPASQGPRWRVARLFRRIIAPLECLVAGFLAALTPWPGVPFVLVAAICVIPMHVFFKTRESDRLMRASEDLVQWEATAARKRFFDGLHGQLTGPVKMTSRLIAQHQPPVDPQLRELGLVLPLLLSSTAAMVDERRWAADAGRTSMREIVQSLSARSQVRTRYREHGSPDATSKDLVLLVLSNLIPNAAVATHTERQRQRRAARAEGHAGRQPEALIGVTITAGDGRITVEVADPAPMIPPQTWCAPGTSLLLLAERLRSLAGDLTQHPLADPEIDTGTGTGDDPARSGGFERGKVIRAVWSTAPHGVLPSPTAHPPMPDRPDPDRPDPDRQAPR